jgi:hypothetical protein
MSQWLGGKVCIELCWMSVSALMKAKITLGLKTKLLSERKAYGLARKRALARLCEGMDLRWTPARSRKEIHERCPVVESPARLTYASRAKKICPAPQMVSGLASAASLGPSWDVDDILVRLTGRCELRDSGRIGEKAGEELSAN